MSNVFFAPWRSISFAWWSLRRRAGQFVPVAISFVLLVGAVQAISALHDVSSVLARQQIARNWRGSYDLLVRPQTAVSQPERGAGWIDPQSLLETYGGIDHQQLAEVQAIAHVAQVTPMAMVGWQPVDVSVPLELAERGVYRVSATWNNQWAAGDTTVRYVDVTGLSQLVQEAPLSGPAVEHLVIGDRPVTFIMALQAFQAVMGVPPAEQAISRRSLLEDVAAAPPLHLSLRLDRLRGGLAGLPGCVQQPACWSAQQVRQGTLSFRVDGVQLLRYSRTMYSATSQQLASGQVSIVPPASDTRGPLYRLPLSEAIALPLSGENDVRLEEATPVPFSMPERTPFLSNDLSLIPLDEACATNGASCYSGLYVRLSGAEHYSQQSLALLQSTAAAISARTGLYVDILDGSSLRSVTFSAQTSPHRTGSFQATWRVVGVAVQIVHGVDALQVTLLALCSLVCLLSIGMSGVLVGIGRRQEALLLRRLGWQSNALVTVFLCDGLALCLPGCLLVAAWTILSRLLWAGSVSPPVSWLLMGVGLLLYCGSLIGGSCWGMGGSRPTVQVVSNLAITLAVFLIAVGYLLMSSFNQALIVTILGRQVRSVLEGPQLVLLAVITGAALLTVGLCSTLLLRGRREELRLLSLIGWERRNVLLRVMRDCCSPALLSGGIGVLVATGVAVLLASVLPSALILCCLLVCGPLLGVSLAGLATIGSAWQETGRVYRWR